MKKWLWIMFIVLIFLFSSCTFMLKAYLPNKYEVIKSNWGIDIPKAENVSQLITTEANFHGDGEWMTLYQYTKDIDVSAIGLKKIENVDEANTQITKFKNKTLEVHGNAAEINSIFKQYPIEAQIGDYYLRMYDNGGNDFIILLYKQKAHQLYIFEWHQ